jgi:hypothetical protein
MTTSAKNSAQNAIEIENFKRQMITLFSHSINHARSVAVDDQNIHGLQQYINDFNRDGDAFVRQFIPKDTEEKTYNPVGIFFDKKFYDDMKSEMSVEMADAQRHVDDYYKNKELGLSTKQQQSLDGKFDATEKIAKKLGDDAFTDQMSKSAKNLEQQKISMQDVHTIGEGDPLLLIKKASKLAASMVELLTKPQGAKSKAIAGALERGGVLDESKGLHKMTGKEIDGIQDAAKNISPLTPTAGMKGPSLSP